MRKIFFCLFVLLIISASVFAKEKEPNFDFWHIKGHLANIVFDKAPLTFDFNGLKLTAISPIVDRGRIVSDSLDKTTYYTDGHNFPGVNGVSIEFTNDTQNAVILSWKDSVVSVNGQSYGMPCFANMNYRDVGNPSATPNTVIPPKQKVTVFPLVSTVIYGNEGSRWLNPVPIPRSGDLIFSYYINVIINGQNAYLTLVAPNIYLKLPGADRNAVKEMRSNELGKKYF